MTPDLLLGTVMQQLNGPFLDEDARRLSILKARRELQELLRTHGELGRARYYIGVCELLLGRSTQALEQFNAVLSMHPSADFASEIYLNIASAHEALEDLDAAEEALILADYYAVKSDIRTYVKEQLRAIRTKR